jgi:hypothetical protein
MRRQKTRSKARRPYVLDDGDAFVRDSRRDARALDDDEAESYGEELVTALTSCESVAEAARDEIVIEELGGPFLELGPADLRSAWAFAEEPSPEAADPDRLGG